MALHATRGRGRLIATNRNSTSKIAATFRPKTRGGEFGNSTVNPREEISHGASAPEALFARQVTDSLALATRLGKAEVCGLG